MPVDRRLGQQVPQQHHIADGACLGEPQPAGRGRSGAQPAGRPRIADEQRRHREVQLVGVPAAQKLRQHASAALHQQPAYPAAGQVLEHLVEVVGRDDGGGAVQPAVKALRVGRVHQRADRTGGEEPPPGVQVAGRGQGNPQGIFRFSVHGA